MSAPSTRVVFVGRRRGALRAARRLGHEVVLLSAGELDDPETTASALLPGQPIRAVLAATEGAVVPAARLREALGLGGTSIATATRFTDKLEMKAAIRRAGLPCADHVGAEELAEIDRIVERLGLPLVIKRRAGSGGRGTRIVHRRQDLPEALEPGWMAERFVEGTEMSVEALVHQGRVVFLNATEYLVPRWANVLPAALSPQDRHEAEALTRAALDALELERGMIHLELFLAPGGAVFGEVAARPPGGHIMELIERAYGFDPWAAWLEIETGVRPAVKTPAKRVAGVWLLHPGAGKVARIDGLEAAGAVAGVEQIAMRVAPGDVVDERVGAGQEAGHILVTGADRDEVAASLTEAHGLVSIVLEA